MRSPHHRIYFGALFAVALASCAAASLPRFNAPVVDNADVLSAATEQSVNSALENFRVNVGPQIAVLTIASTGSKSIEDYGIDLAREWGIGNKTRDDGVLLIIAMQDRTLRIETGSGVEGDLTDIEAGRIIDNIIAPKLKAGDPDGAVADGVNALITELSGGTSPTSEGATSGVSGTIGSSTVAASGASIIAVGFTLLALIGLFIAAAFRARRRGVGSLAFDVLAIFLIFARSGSGRSGGFSGGGGGFSGGGASGSW